MSGYIGKPNQIKIFKFILFMDINEIKLKAIHHKLFH